MIAGAALCPAPPLLARRVTGRDPVLPELREACAQAVSGLLAAGPGEVVVVAPAAATGDWDPVLRLDVAAIAPPGISPEPSRKNGMNSATLPTALGLGSMLLDEAGYQGPRRLQAVGQHEPAAACAGLGRRLAAAGPAVGLLVMGDASARRTLKAPGYLDSRAAGFDAGVEAAVRAGDVAALGRLDQALAAELMVTGWPAWQVLAGALDGARPVTDVLYCDAPFGVGYLVAALRMPGAGSG